MKRAVILTLAVTLSCLAADGPAPLKECKTVVSLDDKTVDYDITFEKKGSKIVSHIKESQNGRSFTLDDVALISEHDIRGDLLQHSIETASDEYLDSLNKGERYILHAASFDDEDEPVKELVGFLSEGKMKNECSAQKPKLSPGIDLKKVKHVKVYEIQGEPGDMSKAAVIEATDDKGKILGSFFGGFLVSPCK